MLTPAHSSDLAALTTLFELSFANYAKHMGRKWPGPYPWLEAALERSEVWWIGDEAGAIVMHQDGTTLKIDQIGIYPEHQGAGIGAKAMEAAEDYARSINCTEITLHTAQIMTHLVAFYSRAGYRVGHVGPHPKGRDDRLRVFMVKSLS